MAEKTERTDTTPQRLASTVGRYLGEQIAVMCARYQYRGILSEIHEDHLVLAKARSVEVSGRSSLAAPETEDIIGSSIVISYAAIEIVYQPNWAFAPL